MRTSSPKTSATSASVTTAEGGPSALPPLLGRIESSPHLELADGLQLGLGRGDPEQGVAVDQVDLLAAQQGEERALAGGLADLLGDHEAELFKEAAAQVRAHVHAQRIVREEGDGSLGALELGVGLAGFLEEPLDRIHDLLGAVGDAEGLAVERDDVTPGRPEIRVLGGTGDGRRDL